jgi:hypothetical protein
MQLPSTDSLQGGTKFTTAFLIPYQTTTTIQGRSQAALLLPVETQRYPEIYLPGIPMTEGPALGRISYQGSHPRARRIVDSSRMFVDPLTGRPLRYLSTITATIGDTTSVVLKRSHVRFRHDGVASISLPVTFG